MAKKGVKNGSKNGERPVSGAPPKMTFFKILAKKISKKVLIFLHPSGPYLGANFGGYSDENGTLQTLKTPENPGFWHFLARFWPLFGNFGVLGGNGLTQVKRLGPDWYLWILGPPRGPPNFGPNFGQFSGFFGPKGIVVRNVCPKNGRFWTPLVLTPKKYEKFWPKIGKK